MPKNFSITVINDDFLTHHFDSKYDLVIGNPPFSKLKGNKRSPKHYMKMRKNGSGENLNRDAFWVSDKLSERRHVRQVDVSERARAAAEDLGSCKFLVETPLS